MPELPECPVCGGELFMLGALGWMLHCRCRNCGQECMFEVKKPDKEESDAKPKISKDR